MAKRETEKKGRTQKKKGESKEEGGISGKKNAGAESLCGEWSESECEALVSEKWEAGTGKGTAGEEGSIVEEILVKEERLWWNW